MICATRVKFLGINGMPYELEHAKKELEVGKEYRVHSIEIEDFKTYIFIDLGSTVQSFNSVMFEGVEGSEI